MKFLKIILDHFFSLHENRDGHIAGLIEVKTEELGTISSLNSVNILGLQISSSLSWRDHIVQIAKSASKKIGGSLSL